MSDDVLEQVNRILQEVVTPEIIRKGPTVWPGPLKKTTQPKQPKRCLGCGTQLSRQLRAMGCWWCEPCKDPDGYLPRLEKASAEARDRCRTAYPPANAEQLSLY
jgi:hypothetical protein